ncbi:MAG: hypothetical protein GF311_12230 [Candidatus Lokiarchaeota archaeon]|nr:hypothetical protein [Candidatus Lokiarchaeota archaeon]
MFELNHFSELTAAVYPHDLTIYFTFALASFIALVQVFVCICPSSIIAVI